MITITLTNPDVVLYRGENRDKVDTELKTFEILKAAGMLDGRELEIVDDQAPVVQPRNTKCS